jgi:hypothetical protein
MKFTPRSIILLALSAAHNSTAPTTAFFKRMYFVSELLRAQGLDTGFDFVSGSYGPTSNILSGELGTLVGTGQIWVRFTARGHGETGLLPYKREYGLTDDSLEAVEQLKNEDVNEWKKIRLAVLAVQTAEWASRADDLALCAAARLHWENECARALEAPDKALAMVRTWRWAITDAQIQRALDFIAALRCPQHFQPDQGQTDCRLTIFCPPATHQAIP